MSDSAKTKKQLLAEIEDLRGRIEALTAIGSAASHHETSHGDVASLQAIIDGLPEAVLVIDREHRVVLANRTIRELSGQDPVASCLRCHELSHGREAPCDVADHPCPLAEALASKAPVTVTHTHVDADGNPVLVDVTAAPLFDEAGEVALIVQSCRDVSQRERDAEHLRRTTCMLNAILDSATEFAIMATDLDFRIIQFNPTAARLHGYEPENVIGRTVFDIHEVEDVDPERFGRAIEAARRDGRYEYVAERKTAAGEPQWIHSTIMPMRDDRGEITGYVHVAHDITNRVLAEDELRRERNLFAGGPCIVFRWVAAEGWPVEYVSPNVAELFGCTAEDFMSGRVVYADIVHPDDLERVVADVQTHSAEGAGCFEQDYRIIRPDGATRHLYDFTVVNRDAGGRITHYDGYVLDMTERMEEQAAARENARKLATLMSNLPGMAYRCRNDADWTMEFVSGGCAELTGCDPEDLVNSESVSYAELIHIDDREQVWTDVQNALKQREPFELVYRINSRDGREKWVWEMGRGVESPDGDLVALEGFITDITERKAAEEERRELEAQVQHAQKLESLGVLAGGIAHDFNNLLVGILGNAGLALDDLPAGSPAVKSIRGIETAAKRAADLTRQMLAYSGKGRFVVECMSLNDVIEEMTRLLDVSISKKVVLRYNFSENLPGVEADRAQIIQVIMNLITNASEAIGDKSGVVSISTGAMMCDAEYLSRTYVDENLGEGLYVYVEVADTGCGMDEQTLARIFDPFFTTKFTGRGLGLAAVQGIIRGHGGAMRVYSEPGRGTTFKVLLPAAEQPQPTRPCFEIEEAGCNRDGVVLLVDDDETVRAVGARMLEASGLQVLTAADGREAMDIYQTRPDEICCVVLDLTMPRMDGEDVFRELRRIREDVCVVLSSGYNEQEVSQRFAGKGLAGFIQKPYERRELLAAVRKALENKSKTKTRDSAADPLVDGV